MNFDKIFICILFFSGVFISEVDARQPDITGTNKSVNTEVTGWRAACVIRINPDNHGGK